MHSDIPCECPNLDGWSAYRWCASPADFVLLSNRYGPMTTFCCRTHALGALMRGGITQILRSDSQAAR